MASSIAQPDEERSAREISGPTASDLPLARFLRQSHAELAGDRGGALADYIPELAKTNPDLFGIAVTTVDGYVYEVGDSAIPFTIQSISKPFVFALALDSLGAEEVERVIGVEPSGEAFNSIRLRGDNRPFNPMVNAGAIACSGLVQQAEGSGAFERIIDRLGRFAGRTLDFDRAVHESEQATGDRNRAIAYLLRTHGILKGSVEDVLDVYFRQCSILVTARDLAVMSATLANNGVNPVTAERVVSPYAVARTLSVMSSSGMYDYAGEWGYRVGIPAKSGVSGGIVAALPTQLGLGTYSPPIDEQGNSVRGIRFCEALSSRFGLHLLSRSGDVKRGIAAGYDIGGISSRRDRQPHEQAILDRHQRRCVVLELVGALGFGTMEYASRRLAEARLHAEFVLLDFRRVSTISAAAARLLADSLDGLTTASVTVILCGLAPDSAVAATLEQRLAGLPGIRRMAVLDEAIEWAEDQIIYRNGGYVTVHRARPLAEQALLEGLSDGELEALSAAVLTRTYHAGERLIAAGEPAASLMFVSSGMVSVKLPSGVRLATLAAGMAVGEMALLESRRSADVWADTHVQCLELPLAAFDAFRQSHPHAGERIVRNLAALLAKRLIVANRKIDLLASY